MVKELSSEYGVSEANIYKWIKQYSPIDIEGWYYIKRIHSSIEYKTSQDIE